MLGKTSISMMVLLRAPSLIGISSIHQYVEGQTPPPAATPKQQIATTPLTEPPKSAVGNVLEVISYTSVAGCIAAVLLGTNVPNDLGLKPGTPLTLFAERE